MYARAPLAFSPYLLITRILLFVVFLPAGIHEVSNVEFTGPDAERVRRFIEPTSAEPKLIEPSTTPITLVSSQGDDAGPDTVTARALYRDALLFEDAGWSNPVLLAYIDALLQLLGGSLLLVGLLSRLWGFGLCVVTGVSFALGSVPLLQESVWSIFHLGPNDMNQVAAQLGLFGLALGIMVCGPGAYSLDRLIFGKAAGHRRHEEIHDDEDDDE